MALLPAVTADRFGHRDAGAVIGVLYTGRGIALLAAAPALALLSEWSGGYALPLGAMALAAPAGWRCLRPCRGRLRSTCRPTRQRSRTT